MSIPTNPTDLRKVYAEPPAVNRDINNILLAIIIVLGVLGLIALTGIFFKLQPEKIKTDKDEIRILDTETNREWIREFIRAEIKNSKMANLHNDVKVITS